MFMTWGSTIHIFDLGGDNSLPSLAETFALSLFVSFVGFNTISQSSLGSSIKWQSQIVVNSTLIIVICTIHILGRWGAIIDTHPTLPKLVNFLNFLNFLNFSRLTIWTTRPD